MMKDSVENDGVIVIGEDDTSEDSDVIVMEEASEDSDTGSVSFPNTLEGFGYKFENGCLKHIETGAPFEFQVRKDDQQYNQKRYEALGEVITEYVYDYIMKEGKLKKMTIPIDASPSEPSTFIFHSEDAFVNPKIIILIHGSGVVRAGQWARRLIINDCLNSGTQLPFIKRAMGLGYGVFVLNTNDNTREVDGHKKFIRHNKSPKQHAQYVMTEVILKSAAAKHIAIIAHSYGGVVTVNLLSRLSDHLSKFFAVAFTDSAHSLHIQIPEDKKFVREWFKNHALNWVSSHHPLDTPVPHGNQEEVDCMSAGTQRHDLTSWNSFGPIFEFIDQAYHLSTAYSA